MNATLSLSTKMAHILLEAVSDLLALGHRTALALLGIILGCASILAILNIGNEAKTQALSAFENMGTNTLIASFPGGLEEKKLLLSNVHVDEVNKKLPAFDLITAISIHSTQIKYSDKVVGTSLIGVSSSILPMLNISMREGRFIKSIDGYNTYAVIGSTLAHELSPPQDPIHVGRKIKIGAYQLIIIGIINDHADNPLFPFQVNKSVFISMDSMKRFQNPVEISTVAARTIVKSVTEKSANDLQQLLLETSGRKNIYMQIPQQLLDSLENQSKTFSYLLLGLGSLSLLIGGGGVMNVMLMSVTQRRKEIGLRMALGATPEDILGLFLLEATCLSSIGTVAGLLLGATFTWAFCKSVGWEFNLAIETLSLAAGSSLMTGIAFGILPAITASRLSPAKALRDE